MMLIITVYNSHSQDSISQLESPVNYTAEDSMILDIKGEKAYLFEGAHIDYGEYSLDACFIIFDFKTKNVTAKYCTDSLGNKRGLPVLSDGETSTEADSLKFNFESKRGITYHVKLQEGEGYVHGNKVKRQENGEIHIDTALYTTCNLDHPHYYFKLRKAIIIPDDKIISGPINLYIADIPTPLGLPFAFLPNQKKGSNGVIIPTYGESTTLGFFLAGGGYYHKFKNEQLSTAITGDIYTKGSWALYNNTSYAKRYKYTGNLGLTFRKTRLGEKAFDDYSEKTDFLVEWNHKQDPKSIPGMTFRASIKAGTGSVYANSFGNNAVNANNYLTNTFNSNIAFGKTFRKIPSNFSINLRHSQNSNTRIVSFTLPDITYSVNRFYPAKWFNTSNVVKSNARKQLEKIGITYILNAKNETSIADTLLSINHLYRLEDNMKNGIKHTATMAASFPFFGNAITFTPSVNANALMYAQQTKKSYDAETHQIITDTLSRFGVPMWATFTAAFTSKIYGFYEFSEFLQTQKHGRVRHVITPSANFSLRPNNGLQYSYVRDSLGNLNYATPFDSQIFGSSPTGSSGKVTFNLINAFELRQNNLKDTTGNTPFIYKNILDNLTLSSGYDIMRDSLNWDNLSLSGRTNIAKLFTTRFGASFDPYARDSNNIIINQFTKDVEGKLFNMTNASIALGINLKSKKNKEKVLSKNPQDSTDIKNINDNLDQYLQFGEAWNWSLNLGYNLAYNRQFLYEAKDTFRLTQTINVSGQMNITANWNVNFQTNYDIANKKFSYTSVEITRDLHCWEMSFNWVPFGYMKSYQIQINVKSSLLQDLKLQRRRTWYDNGVRS
ncbi:MAG: hypothetical protein H6600_02530 [Flavobacteriales bacterium]|nr:hypothetical protein [Flavobacteriales bacterium]